MVLCHGLGADAYDLIDLGPILGGRGAGRSVRLGQRAGRALLRRSAGNGGRQRSPARGHGRWRRRAAGFLNEFLDAELARLGLPADAYALMGFSQGAMTVLFTGLRRPVAPRVILAFSGALIAPETLAAEQRNAAPVLLVHGEADGQVPVTALRDAEVALRARACRWRRCTCRTSATASTIPASRWERGVARGVCVTKA